MPTYDQVVETALTIIASAALGYLLSALLTRRLFRWLDRRRTMLALRRVIQEVQKMTNAGLCVGGPLDGKMYASTKQGFVVPDRRVIETSYATEHTRRIGAQQVEILRTEYVPETFNAFTDAGDVRSLLIWRPKDQSLADTMEKLLIGYCNWHPANARERQR